MKTALFTFLFVASACLSSFSQGYTYVNGYYRSNGTYVEGHYRSLPNSTRDDNFSTIGNVNPFTGVPGTRQGDIYIAPSRSYSIPDYPVTPVITYPSTFPAQSWPSSSFNYPTYRTPAFPAYPSWNSNPFRF